MKTLYLAGLLAIAALAACSVTIPVVDPKPNIALVPQQKSLALVLGNGIEDLPRVVVGNNTVTVQSWRATLENGFRNGFRGVFPAPQGGSTDLTLRLDKAEIEFGDFNRKPARIQYAVTLLEGGSEVRRYSGTASRKAPMFQGAIASSSTIVASNVAASVAAMYERLAQELFASPGAAAKSCVPGQSVGCVGPKGCQGFQVCAGDGARFEPCSCN